jgi:hypothetical protein
MAYQDSDNNYQDNIKYHINRKEREPISFLSLNYTPTSDKQSTGDQSLEYEECQNRSHQEWLATYTNLESCLEQVLDLSKDMITQDEEFKTELRNNFKNIS